MDRSIYDGLKTHFRNHSEVEVAERKGAQGLKHNGKMFAMFYKGDLTVKLKPKTVQTLLETGEGLPHDPGTGSPMKDRILIPQSRCETWIDMCERSLREVR